MRPNMVKRKFAIIEENYPKKLKFIISLFLFKEINVHARERYFTTNETSSN